MVGLNAQNAAGSCSGVHTNASALIHVHIIFSWHYGGRVLYRDEGPVPSHWQILPGWKTPRTTSEARAGISDGGPGKKNGEALAIRIAVTDAY